MRGKGRDVLPREREQGTGKRTQAEKREETSLVDLKGNRDKAENTPDKTEKDIAFGRGDQGRREMG